MSDSSAPQTGGRRRRSDGRSSLSAVGRHTDASAVDLSRFHHGAAWVTVACCVAACGPAGLRWLRVAQREHYLAGSVSRFAGRWWASTPATVSLAPSSPWPPRRHRSRGPFAGVVVAAVVAARTARSVAAGADLAAGLDPAPPGAGRRVGGARSGHRGRRGGQWAGRHPSPWWPRWPFRCWSTWPVWSRPRSSTACRPTSSTRRQPDCAGWPRRWWASPGPTGRRRPRVTSPLWSARPAPWWPPRPASTTGPVWPGPSTSTWPTAPRCSWPRWAPTAPGRSPTYAVGAHRASP